MAKDIIFLSNESSKLQIVSVQIKIFPSLYLLLFSILCILLNLYKNRYININIWPVIEKYETYLHNVSTMHL